MKTYDYWMEASENAKYWADKEKELRIKICDKLLEGKAVGTHNLKEGKYKIKVVKKIIHSLDSDFLGAIWDELSEEEQASIKMSPKLLLKEYNGLEDHSTLDQVITVKPAMPTLSIEYVES